MIGTVLVIAGGSSAQQSTGRPRAPRRARGPGVRAHGGRPRGRRRRPRGWQQLVDGCGAFAPAGGRGAGAATTALVPVRAPRAGVAAGGGRAVELDRRARRQERLGNARSGRAGRLSAAAPRPAGAAFRRLFGCGRLPPLRRRGAGGGGGGGAPRGISPRRPPRGGRRGGVGGGGKTLSRAL